MIERFSEDIDLILDWRVLGYTASYLWAERSKTSQDKINKEMDAKTGEFLRDLFLPQLKADFSKLLPDPFELYINDDEQQTICFAYPRIFNNQAIISVVRMEHWNVFFYIALSVSLTFGYYTLFSENIVTTLEEHAVPLLLVITITLTAYMSILHSLKVLSHEAALREDNLKLQNSKQAPAPVCPVHGAAYCFDGREGKANEHCKS